MYKCSATCVENMHYNMTDVQKCVNNCSVPVNSAQEFLEKELSSFQVCLPILAEHKKLINEQIIRLLRLALDCVT